MNLRARYDQQEDRMRLTLHPVTGESHSFWVTRRQWIGLLNTLTKLPIETERPKQSVPAPQQKYTQAHESIAEPLPLDGIRVRRIDNNGIKLIFVTGMRGVFVKIPSAGIESLQRMLEQQADRADWDVSSALTRLHAADLTKVAMKKAQKRPQVG